MTASAGEPGFVRPRNAAACSVCGVALDAAVVRFSSTCDRPACRLRARLDAERPALERAAEEARLRAERAAAELRAARLAALRARRAASAAAVVDADGYALGIVPSNQLPLVDASPERAGRFAEHLTAVIAEAAEAPAEAGEAPVEPASTMPVAVQRGACAMCRGFCCRAGKEHAFQDAESMRGFMAAHPGWDPERIVAAYLERLPSRSFEGACVFQAEDGCALPREMRSVTCNRHLCADLRTLHIEMVHGDTQKAFVGSFDGERLVRAGFLGTDPDPAAVR